MDGDLSAPTTYVSPTPKWFLLWFQSPIILVSDLILPVPFFWLLMKNFYPHCAVSTMRIDICNEDTEESSGSACSWYWSILFLMFNSTSLKSYSKSIYPGAWYFSLISCRLVVCHCPSCIKPSTHVSSSGFNDWMNGCLQFTGERELPPQVSDFQFDRYGRRLQYTSTLRGDMHASDCQSLLDNPRFFCECAFVSISKSDQLETVCITLQLLEGVCPKTCLATDSTKFLWTIRATSGQPWFKYFTVSHSPTSCRNIYACEWTEELRTIILIAFRRRQGFGCLKV